MSNGYTDLSRWLDLNLSIVDKRRPTREYCFVDENKMPISTLKNLGNTCFLNSQIQALFHTVPFRQFILTGNYPLTDRLWIEWVKLIKTMCQGNFRMTPNNFYTQFAFLKQKFDHDQEDAHEALHFLLDKFHQALVESGKKFRDLTVCYDEKGRSLINRSMIELNRTSQFSKIKELFMVQLHQRTQCLQCQTVSDRFPVEHEMVLSMENSSKYSNLYHLFRGTCGRQTLKDDDAYHCEKCCEKCNKSNPAAERCTKTEALQKTTIFRYPEILVVVLGRFKCSYDPRIQNMRYDKNEKFIDYPIVNLDLTAHSSYPETTKKLYDLYAVTCHIGSTPHGGHYYTVAKANNKWVVLNDDVYEWVKDLQQVVSSRAYILFYQRKRSY